MNKEVQRLMDLFEGSFINRHNELILDAKTNLYLALGDSISDLELKCKVIAWCSRDACKSMPYRVEWRNKYYQQGIRDRINEFLHTNFTEEQWLYIYCYLGNDIDRKLCEKFINGGYDLKIIKEARG